MRQQPKEAWTCREGVRVHQRPARNASASSSGMGLFQSPFMIVTENRPAPSYPVTRFGTHRGNPCHRYPMPRDDNLFAFKCHIE